MDLEKQYLTYIEYRNYGGTIEQAPFNILEFEARKEIDKATSGRLKKLTSQNEEVKHCMFKLINLLKSNQTNENQNRAISGESIDGYSVTYKNTLTEDLKARQIEVYSIIKTYLSDCALEDGTAYLYRG